jgi:predicted AAA+ superfamily ATPase
MENGNVLRRGYLEKLSEYRDDTGSAKVITGMRRCGKSTLMEQYISLLTASGVNKKQISYLNMESKANRGLLNEDSLYDHLVAGKSKGRSYIFIDEIQNVPGWERTIASLMIDLDCDIYLTGSNAYFLSTDLSTHMTGRSAPINMLPLSFGEFLELNRYKENEKQSAFADYISRGSMPKIRREMSIDLVFETLDTIRSDIIVKDIQKRKKITDNTILGRIIDYLFSEIGNPISVHSVAKNLGIDDKTVDDYISAVSESLMFYRVKRYDLRGNVILRTPEKFYCTDLGMRNAAIGEYSRDTGRSIENIVFLELLRRGYRVSVGKIGNLEVDFVADKGGNREYFQVAQTVMDGDVLERELKPLEEIRDNLNKTLLTMDVVYQENINGIRHYNIIDWLTWKPTNRSEYQFRLP